MIALVMVAVLTALCGGAMYLAEKRDRPVRRAQRQARIAQQN